MVDDLRDVVALDRRPDGVDHPGHPGFPAFLVEETRGSWEYSRGCDTSCNWPSPHPCGVFLEPDPAGVRPCGRRQRAHRPCEQSFHGPLLSNHRDIDLLKQVLVLAGGIPDQFGGRSLQTLFRRHLAGPGNQADRPDYSGRRRSADVAARVVPFHDRAPRRSSDPAAQGGAQDTAGADTSPPITTN